jgi:hypothetical protein
VRIAPRWSTCQELTQAHLAIVDVYTARIITADQGGLNALTDLTKPRDEAMAKPNNTSTTVGWIWLREALARAHARFGSVALAKKRLVEWLAAGELPWSCMSWETLDAETIARLDQDNRDAIAGKNRGWSILHAIPSGPYREGDPQFWCANLKIDWKDNGACEQATGGAKALGIKVSLERLLALLPDESPEREEIHGTGAWIAAEAKRMKDANKIPADIRISEFARKLERNLNKAAKRDDSLRPIKAKSIENGLRDWGVWPVASIK